MGGIWLLTRLRSCDQETESGRKLERMPSLGGRRGLWLRIWPTHHILRSQARFLRVDLCKLFNSRSTSNTVPCQLLFRVREQAFVL